MKKSMRGPWKPEWTWLSPDWKDINNPNTSTVGFKEGDALTADARKQLARFIRDLGANKVRLFKGPLNYQDGSVFLSQGEVATDRQIWYMPKLLEGMLGASSAK